MVLSLNYILPINFISNKDDILFLLMLALLFTFSIFFFNQAERKDSIYWTFLKNPARENKLYSSIQNRGELDLDCKTMCYMEFQDGLQGSLHLGIPTPYNPLFLNISDIVNMIEYHPWD